MLGRTTNPVVADNTVSWCRAAAREDGGFLCRRVPVAGVAGCSARLVRRLVVGDVGCVRGQRPAGSEEIARWPGLNVASAFGAPFGEQRQSRRAVCKAKTGRRRRL